MEVAPGGRLAAAQLYAGWRHAQATASLVLRQHTGDVVIHHDHLVRLVEHLLRKNAYRRRPTTHPHALLLDAVDNRRAARLDDDFGTAFNAKFNRLLVAQALHHLHRDTAFFLGAAGQVVYTAERKHLRAVFRSGHMADHLAPAKHIGLLGPEIAVGVDLDLEAAVTEDAFGDHCDHVDTACL